MENGQQFVKLIKNMTGKLNQKNVFAYAIILITVILGFIMYANFDLNANLASYGDAQKYQKMAEETFAAVENPFALRILSPFIVHTMVKTFDISMNNSWMILTFSVTFITLVFFYHILADYFKLNYFTSVVFTIFLGYTYSYTLFNYGDYWLVDPLNNFFYLTAIFFLFKRKLIFFTLTIILASTNKEVILFLAPLYLLLSVMETGKISDKKVIKAGFSLLLMIVSYFVYRKFTINLISAASQFKMFTGEAGRGVADTIRFDLSYMKDQIFIFRVFNFLWFFAGFSLYELYKRYGIKNDLIITSAYLFLTVMFGRLFATDADRVFVMLAPIVVILSATFFDKVSSFFERQCILVFLFIYISLNLNWLDQTSLVPANLFVLILFILIFYKKDVVNHFSNKEIA